MTKRLVAVSLETESGPRTRFPGPKFGPIQLRGVITDGLGNECKKKKKQRKRGAIE